jgi:CBS domain-containing protein
MKAAEVMTPKVATIRPDETVREAAHMMLQFGISGLPVVDPAGRLVGIVAISSGPRTSGDLLKWRANRETCCT